MRVKLHMISAPWAPISVPSIQIGALRAYVKQKLGNAVTIKDYSAFLELLYRYNESSCLFFYFDYQTIAEEIYTLIYHSRYLKKKYPVKPAELGNYIKRLTEFTRRGTNDSISPRDKKKPVKLNEDILNHIEKQTLAYVEEKILPELNADGVNVIGFTLNFSQVYASLLMARMILERSPNKNILFLFGGFSASLPEFLPLLKRLGIDAYSVFGEGEERLVAILKDLVSQAAFTGKLSQPINGVFRTGEVVDLFERDETLFRSQLKDIGELPTPIYDEFFELHARLCKTDPFISRTLQAQLVIEGTRGCFAKCDFCNLNLLWDGFRKQSGERIIERINELHRRYGTRDVIFLDNICDTFAESLADIKLKRGDKYALGRMNMRVHHPQAFWAKLAAAGLDSATLGVEALSSPLLRLMSKGTYLIQNLRVIKYFGELGLLSSSGLVTHHPLATENDIRETLKLLKELSHGTPLPNNRFLLVYGSPLYQKLSAETRRKLKPYWAVKPPKNLESIVLGYGYALPKEYRLSTKKTLLWQKVDRYCSKGSSQPYDQRPVFTVKRLPDGRLAVLDTRFKKRRTHLSGLSARIFDLCHEGLKLEMLELKLGLSRDQFERELSRLVKQRWILLADDYYFTLAFRPRHEVVWKPEEKPKESPRPSLQVPIERAPTDIVQI